MELVQAVEVTNPQVKIMNTNGLQKIYVVILL
jgi:hypothetical protein